MTIPGDDHIFLNKKLVNWLHYLDIQTLNTNHVFVIFAFGVFFREKQNQSS